MEPFTSKVSKVSERVLFSDFRKYKAAVILKEFRNRKKISMDKTELFEKMPVRIAVRKQIVPAIISQMVTLIYNLADTYFVGLLNDPAQTAAVAVAAPIFLMLTAISNLFGVGGASTFAQALGRKENRTASQISSIAFWFGLLASVLFAFFVLIFMRPILMVCGATTEIYELVRSYVMWTVIIGGPGTVLNILLANLIRGEGSAGIASFGVSAGGFLNILLDPFFVLPQFLNMGAAGAGLATAISNLATTLFFLGYVFSSKNKTLLSVSPSHLRYTRERIGLILSIGVANGLLPLLAYNYAAGNRERQRRAFQYGCGIAVGFSVLCLIVYEAFAPNIAAIFIKDADTIDYAAAFLRRMVVAMPMVDMISLLAAVYFYTRIIGFRRSC